MINGLEGIPGSGKSYEATVYHVLAALQTGRLVITNLPLNVEVFAAIDPSYRSLIQIRRRPAPVLGVWSSMPEEIINILGLLGVGPACGIIVAAIAIRLVLQLIPFTRLGS